MTIEETIKDIQEDGINLGAGDYVDTARNSYDTFPRLTVRANDY